MSSNRAKNSTKARIIRALVEVAFIIFLFYSNLLMGEFTKSGNGYSKGLEWAVDDVFTEYNFVIAVFAAFVGHVFFQYLRRRV